jgi:long-chain fatty acid transport protein
MGYKKRLTVAALALALAPAAWATDGYFSHGYGMTAKGMGGAATAMTKDTFGGANTPASMVWVGDRLDVGLDWFSPKRAVERTNSTGGGAGMNGSAQSGSNDFWIPEFGYNRMLDANKSLGVTVYGNGGMNTDYPGGQIAGGTACGPGGAGFAPATVSAPLNLLCGGGRLGIDLMQLIIAPTFAIKINESNSLGISPLIGYQRF